jgi:hypothetical protein
MGQRLIMLGSTWLLLILSAFRAPPAARLAALGRFIGPARCARGCGLHGDCRC